MTSRQLIRWTARHERRARRGWWTAPWLVALVIGAMLAALVAWRGGAGVDSASNTWIAAAIVAAGLAFLRVPFHLYWRADAALLAQLPIEGQPLLDAALVRCLRAAATTTLALLVAAIPLALLPPLDVAFATRALQATPIAGDTVPHLTPLTLAAHHAVFAIVLGLCEGLLVPAVVVWAAMIVVGPAAETARRAAGIAPAKPAGPPANPATVLGAIPGAAGAMILVAALVATPWLTGTDFASAAPELLGLSIASVVAAVAARSAAARVMPTILRDVSALDRQRLASLEIHPPTAIERAIAGLLGDAALPYRKDARLMRRRYPMAFALGGLAFLVLVIVGLSRPHDPVPWLVGTLGAAAAYAVALAARLGRSPIELPRLSATLPIRPGARRRAKIAWLAGWAAVFVLVPLAFALARVLQSAAP